MIGSAGNQKACLCFSQREEVGTGQKDIESALIQQCTKAKEEQCLSGLGSPHPKTASRERENCSAGQSAAMEGMAMACQRPVTYAVGTAHARNALDRTAPQAGDAPVSEGSHTARSGDNCVPLSAPYPSPSQFPQTNEAH